MGVSAAAITEGMAKQAGVKKLITIPQLLCE